MTGPKQGIYLDATLAIIGEQVDERVDELSRHRRTRRRLGITALSVAALASSSVAAVALSSAGRNESPAPVAKSAEHVVECVDGESAHRDAYFTIRFRATEGAGVDQLRLCAQAWSALETQQPRLASATPDELIDIAHGFVTAAAMIDSIDVSVSDAAFGRLNSNGSAPPMIVCESDTVTTVLTPTGFPYTPAERAQICAGAGE